MRDIGSQVGIPTLPVPRGSAEPVARLTRRPVPLAVRQLRDFNRGREPASGLTVAASLTLHPSVPRPSQSLQPRGRLQPKQVAPHSRCSAPGLPVAAAPQALTVAAAPHPPGPHSRCSAQVPLTVAAPKPSPSLSPPSPHSRGSLADRPSQSLQRPRPSQSLQRPRPSLLIQEDG